VGITAIPKEPGLLRKVANCAHCAEYAGCDKLADFFKSVPDARVTLDGIRAAL